MVLLSTPLLRGMFTISTVFKKVRKSINILIGIRHNLNTDILFTLYNMLIQPYFMYCNIVWASQRSLHLQHLLIKEKKCTPHYY